MVGEITFGPVKLERDPNALGASAAPAIAPDAGTLSAEGKVDLTLRSEPSGAAIFIDGRASGRTPKGIQVSANADLSVKMEYRGYFPLTEQMHIGAEALERTFRLDRITAESSRHLQGRVRFEVTPWANVTCNSRKLGPTPFLVDQYLRAGTYQCTFVNPERGTKTQKIEVVANTVQTVRVQF
jgi:serine/threonine-protein kinase